MQRKTEIQYVDQFYVYGSEALAAKKKQEKLVLPREQHQKVHKIYIDPVALLGIVSALVLLTALIFGAVKLNTLWQEHHAMENYLSELRLENANLEHNYRISYDLEDIKTMASAIGLVPQEEVETRYVRVTMPAPKPKHTRMDDIKWFLNGLFE